jgi:hypothetical protein
MNKKDIKRYPEIGGIYQHYKGGKYQVISMSKHSETDEDLVIYKSIHFGSVYARPLEMWFEEINLGGYKKTLRFEPVKTID